MRAKIVTDYDLSGRVSLILHAGGKKVGQLVNGKFVTNRGGVTPEQMEAVRWLLAVALPEKKR